MLLDQLNVAHIFGLHLTYQHWAGSCLVEPSGISSLKRQIQLCKQPAQPVLSIVESGLHALTRDPNRFSLTQARELQRSTVQDYLLAKRGSTSGALWS